MPLVSRTASPARHLLALAALAALSGPAAAVTYSWSTGTFPGDSSAPPVLGIGDTLNIVTGGTKYLNSPLSSSGTIKALDDLYFQSGNTLSSSGLFDFKADVGFYDGGYNGNFVNTGIFRKSLGTGTSLISIAGFSSTGTVDTQIGTMQFNTYASFGAGSQFTGSGSTLINGGASFTGGLTSANLTLANGSFNGSGAQISGTVAWTSGSLTGDWTVLSSQQLALTGSGTHYLNGSLANAGTVTAGTDLYFQSGNVLTNTGLYNWQGDYGFFDGGYNGSFVNNGTLRKGAGTGTSAVSIAGFTNNGTIEVQTGTINFNTGATFNNGTVFTGAGSVVVSGGASFNGGYTTQSNLTLSAGTFTGTGAMINGNTVWSGGRLNGDWTLALGKTLTLASGGTKYLNASFSNLGTVVAGDDLYFQSGNTLTNSGLYDIQGDFSLVDGGYNGNFTNSGTLRKSGGSGTSNVSITGFSNSGTIEVQTGTINFNGGATFNAGTVFKGPGAVVVSNGASFNGGYTTQGNLTLSGGTFTGTGAAINGDTVWSSGRLNGDWTLSAGKTLALASGGTKYLNGSFSNLGTVAASDDLYFVSGNTLTNAALYDFKGDFGLLDGGYNGNFANSGTLRKSSGTGTSNVAITGFSNTGTIDVQTGTILFSGNPLFSDGTKFTGGGQVVVNNSASFAGGYTTQANLLLAGGTFTGTGAVINGDTTFSSGRLNGDWTLAAGHTLALVGGGTKYINGSFNNLGTVAASDDLYFLSGNTLTNAGLYDFKGDFGLLDGGYNGVFINNGTLTKSAGVGNSNVGISGFINNGIIQAQSGTILFSANPQFNNGSQFTGAGQVVVSNGANFVGSFSTANNLALTAGTFTGGDGTAGSSATLAGGSATLNAGRLNGVWNTAAGTQLNISGGGSKYVNGTVNNNGTINATDDLYFLSGNTLSNSGGYKLNGDVGLKDGGYGGNFVNTGLVVKSAGTGTSDVSAIGFVNAVGGVVDVQTGTIALPNNFTNQGTLKGNGSYATNLLTNAGTVAPGESPGTLTIAGSFVQLASGTLAAELFSATNSDLLNISGTASLGGTLALSCYNGCAGLANGNVITLLNSGGARTGTFSNVTLSGFGSGFAYNVIYDPNDVKLQILNVGAVPEPGTWLMLAMGLGAMGLRMRPRRNAA